MFKIAASAVGLHARNEKLILAARFELAHKRFLKPLPLPVGLREQNENWWTERDSNPYEKFAGLLCCQLHYQPEKNGVEDGILTRTSHVLTKPLHLKALRVSFHSATST